MLNGTILGLLYLLGGLIILVVSISIIFGIIFCIYKIFRYINRLRNPDYIPLVINT